MGTIDFQRSGTLAVVTLKHQLKFNAMTRAMWRELKAVFTDPALESGLRAIVVQGEGAHFCAGGDISEYPAFRFDATSLREFHEGDVWGALEAMLACDVPLLAIIRGNCMGAGLEIASCCDLRWAASSARFGAPIARLGFPMAPREAALVAGAVGPSVARAMLLGATVLGAQRMVDSGFLTGVCDDAATAPSEAALAGANPGATPLADLATQCEAELQTLQALSPMAARLNKQTLRALPHGANYLPNRAASHMGLALPATDLIAKDTLNTTAADPYSYANHAEHLEGISAFLAKRKPQF